MRSRFVSWALVGAIVFFVGAVPGCRSGDDFPSNLDGGWGWMVTRFLHQDRGFGTEDLTGCILDGILTDVQSFNIADVGDVISASFVDTEDNEVTLAGTYVDGRLNGVLTVMSPGGRVVVVDLVLIGGFGADGMPMLDGTATVTADSDDLCVGAEADVWMMEGGAVAPDEPPPTGGPFQGPSMLVAQCRNDDTLVEVDPFNGSTRFITRLPIDILDVSQQLAELSHVSTMVFNEAEFTLWAGTSREVNTGTREASMYRILDNGVVSLLHDNAGEDHSVNGHAGLAQRLGDFAIFGTEGKKGNDAVFVIESKAPALLGAATLIASDIGTENRSGRALTFVGNTLYYAAGTALYIIDQTTGAATRLRALKLDGPFEDEPNSWHISSMTTRPETGVIYATLREQSAGGESFVTINPDSGFVTELSLMEREYHAIAWVPADYFDE